MGTSFEFSSEESFCMAICAFPSTPRIGIGIGTGIGIGEPWGIWAPQK